MLKFWPLMKTLSFTIQFFQKIFIKFVKVVNIEKNLIDFFKS